MVQIIACLIAGFALYLLGSFLVSLASTWRLKKESGNAEFIALRTRFELLQTEARNTSADLAHLRRQFGPLQDQVHSFEAMLYQLRGQVLPPFSTIQDLESVDVDRELEAVRALVASTEPGRPATTYERLLNDD